MMNAVKTERQVIVEMLKLYKDNPCLWDPESKGDRKTRMEAYSLLLAKYRLIAEDANLDSLRKKIDNLRCSYRRERKKIQSIRRYKPSLWYFNLLTFLDKDPITFVGGPEDDEEDADADFDADGDSCVVDETGTSFAEPIELHDDESSEPEVKMETHDSTEPTFIQTEVGVSKALEAEVFGQTVGLQLDELPPMQKTIAEKLISDVIYYARLDKLTTKTRFINLNDDFL